MKEKTRQRLIADGGGNFVYLPKVVARGLGMKWMHITMRQATELGATEFYVKEHGNGIVAKWPQYFFDFAQMIEQTFPATQWLWQPRDKAVLIAAVRLYRSGCGDEAVAICRQHKGVPRQEMPESLLVQAGLAS